MNGLRTIVLQQLKNPVCKTFVMNCHLLQHAKIKKKKKNPLFHIKQTKKRDKYL